MQVSCSSAIRTARAVVSEDCNSSLRHISSKLEANSERDVQRVSSKLGLQLPVPLSQLKVAALEQPIDFLKMSDWARFLASSNLLFTLAGLGSPDPVLESQTWRKFWSNVQKVQPDFPLFQRNVEYGRCMALLVHGDEGRSRKRSALMVVAAHSALGQGMSTSNKKRKRDAAVDSPVLRLNYLGHTLTSRFLLSVLPKSLYDQDNDHAEDGVFQTVLKSITEDFNELYWSGFTALDGEKRYLVPLRVMGDWPFIQKAGYLSRSFMNVSKQATAAKKGLRKGICHRCLADQSPFPWENFSNDNPAWISSYNTVSPFWRDPPLLSLPHDMSDEPAFFSYDLFHAWHLGSGKEFLGSLLVVMSETYIASNIQARFQLMSNDFLHFCAANKLQPYLRKISRDTCGATDFPSGTWSKGSTTTCILKWVVAWGEAHADAVSGDRLLVTALEAARSKNKFLKLVYEQEAFIDEQTAIVLAKLGIHFLKQYGALAKLSFQQGRALWLQKPNLHRLHHIYLDLAWQAGRGGQAYNPLMFSTQADEDFIGRPSRASRRVTPRPFMATKRTLQRHLMSSYAKYVSAGFIKTHS